MDEQDQNENEATGAAPEPSMKLDIVALGPNVAFTEPAAGSLAPLLAEIEQRLDGLAARVAASESHVSTSLISAIQDFDVRSAKVEEARFIQSGEITSLMEYLERAFAGIDTNAVRLNKLTEAAQIATAASERIGAMTGIAEDTLRAMEGLRTHIANNSTAIETSSEESARRLESVEQKILETTTRIDVVEHLAGQASEQANHTLAEIANLGDEQATLTSRQANNEQRAADMAAIAEETLRAMESLRTHIANNKTAIETSSEESARRLESVEQKILETTTRIDVVEHLTGRASEQANHTLAEIANLGDEQATLTSRQANNEQRAADMAAIAEDTLRAMESLQDRISENGASIAGLGRVAADVETRVDADGHRIHEIAALVDEVVPTLQQLSSRMEDARAEIDAGYTEIARLAERSDETSVRLATGDDRIDQIHVRVDDTGQRIDQFHQRIDETGERLDQLHQRVDESGQRIGDARDKISAAETAMRQEIDGLQSEMIEGERLDRLEATVVALKIDDYDTRSDNGTDVEALLTESVLKIETQDASITQLRSALADALDRVQQVESALSATTVDQPPPVASASPSSDRIDQLEAVLVDAVTKVNELAQTQNNAAIGRDPEMASAVGKISNELDGASVELRTQKSEIEMLNARLAELEASALPMTGQPDTTDRLVANGGQVEQSTSASESNGGAVERPDAESSGPVPERRLFRRR